MTLRARHRLGVILGALLPGLGPFLTAQVNRACSGRPRRAKPIPMEGARARRRMVRVCASTRQTPKKVATSWPLGGGD